MYRRLRLIAVVGSAITAAGIGPSSADRPSFSTPSGNIICYVQDDPASASAGADLECYIFSADWAPQTDEVCDLDSTANLTLGAEGLARESIACHGDVFWPIPTPVLSYGSSWAVLDYRCEIAESGVTCTNKSGNGFEIARRGRKTF